MEVKVNITKIIDDSAYPTFVEFELVDIHGKHHLLQDKLKCTPMSRQKKQKL